MTWTTSNRLERLPKNWSSICKVILRRDHFLCQLNYPGCLRKATQVDHIQHGDNHQPVNLQAVCSKCHGTKSAREGNEAKLRKKRAGRRTPMAHPGRIKKPS